MWNIENIDRILNIQKNRVPGHSIVTAPGSVTNLSIGIESTLWENPSEGTINYLSSAQTMFLSSTDSGDNQFMICNGLDANFDPIVGRAILNGQNQVEVVNIATGAPIQFRRVIGALINGSNTDLAGDVYMSESDTLTLGIPDDQTKVHNFVLAIRNISRTSIFTTRRGYTAFLFDLIISAHKNDEVSIDLMTRREGGVFVRANTMNIFEDLSNINIPFIPMPEKTDFEIRVTAFSNNSSLSVIPVLELVDNKFLP